MEIRPLISNDLITYLRTRYPDRCPDLHLSDREYGAYYGARALVRHLEALFEDQTGLDDEPVQINSRTRRRR